MKQKAYFIEAVTATDFESIIVRDPAGRILFAGNCSEFLTYLGNEFANLKASENEIQESN